MRFWLHKAARSVSIWHVLAVALVVRLPHLGACLWHDEVLSTAWNLRGPHYLLDWILGDTLPPFHYLFMYAWSIVAQDREVWMRLPSLAFGLGSIYVTYAWVERAFDRRRALLTAYALALSPVHIWYSQEARQYMAMIFFFSACLYMSYAGMDFKKRSRECASFAATTLFLLCHYYAIILVALQSLLKMRRSGRFDRGVKALVFAMLIFTSILVSQHLFRNIDYPRDTLYLFNFEAQRWEKLFFRWFTMGMTERLRWDDSWMLYMQPLFTALFAAGAIVFLRGAADPSFRAARATRLDVLALMTALPLAMLAANLAGFDNYYYERFAIPSLPLFLLVSASGPCILRPSWARQGFEILFVVLVCLSFAAYFTHRDSKSWVFMNNKPDMASVIRYVAEESGAKPWTVEPWPYGWAWGDCRYSGKPLLISWRVNDKRTVDYYNEKAGTILCTAPGRVVEDVLFSSSTYRTFFMLSHAEADFTLPKDSFQRIGSKRFGGLVAVRFRRKDPVKEPVPPPFD